MAEGAAPPFAHVQNGFYNAFSQLLGLAPGSAFQLVQPATAITAHSGSPDPALWTYLNVIPPCALTQHGDSGNEFFRNYEAVIGALLPASERIDIERDIGADAWNDWMAYLETVSPAPPQTRLPALFRDWAGLHYPHVAALGAYDYTEIVLDPIAAAAKALAVNYSQFPLSPARPDWSLGYDDLVRQLGDAASVRGTLTSASWNTSTRKTWAPQSTNVYGVWQGDSAWSPVSSAFAAGTTTVVVSFDRVTTFAPAPGSWYSPAALGLAFSAGPDKPPWNPASPITWDTTFGPGGTMQRFAVSLVVGSGMNVIVTSSAPLTSTQAGRIADNAGTGLWPFYTTVPGTASSVAQNPDGAVTLTCSAPAGVPFVLGVCVVAAAQFLGH